MTHADKPTDDHEHEASGTNGIPPNEEAAMDNALRAEDEADEAAAAATVASDEHHQDSKTSE